MPPHREFTLGERLHACSASAEKTRFLADAGRCFPLITLNAIARLRDGLGEFSARNVLIRTKGQMEAVIAVLALDGTARRILLCPPDVSDEHIPQLMRDGEADCILSDADIDLATDLSSQDVTPPSRHINTEWVLFTSGTSGVPKLVLHNLASLTAPLGDGPAIDGAVWSTFYDIRRYGGLQILLRAFCCGGSLVLSESDEPVSVFLDRLADANVTRISGTPTHWRRVLMSGAAARIAPNVVRLSGEMAGQDILDRLRATYPLAAVEHVFASTEAGVAFGVADGRAGFPMAVLNASPARPAVCVDDGVLRIRSRAAASRYLGETAPKLLDTDGFVTTGDIVERLDDRYVFVGRQNGVVNVGGFKVHPEEVEAVINRHPAVAMCRVWSRPNAVVGTLIAADIVLAAGKDGTSRDFSGIKKEIMAECRARLAAHKVPVHISEVTEILMTSGGKIGRRHA